MATVTERESKYDVPPEFQLPDLARAGAVARVAPPAVHKLDAPYLDTAAVRLARTRVTGRPAARPGRYRGQPGGRRRGRVRPGAARRDPGQRSGRAPRRARGGPRHAGGRPAAAQHAADVPSTVERRPGRPGPRRAPVARPAARSGP